MEFLYIKSIHIIFVVSWFAALFYIVRLFIYAAEAQTKEEFARPVLTRQLLFMQRKLWYIIGWPAAIIANVFGLWMIVLVPDYLTQPWMLLKLIAVGLLWLYQIQCHRIFIQQKKGIYKWSSFKLRMFNELATVFLVAIVFLVVVKSQAGLLWGMLGTFVFAGSLMFFVYLYRKKDKSKSNVTNESNKPSIEETREIK